MKVSVGVNISLIFLGILVLPIEGFIRGTRYAISQPLSHLGSRFDLGKSRTTFRMTAIESDFATGKEEESPSVVDGNTNENIMQVRLFDSDVPISDFSKFWANFATFLREQRMFIKTVSRKSKRKLASYVLVLALLVSRAMHWARADAPPQPTTYDKIRSAISKYSKISSLNGAKGQRKRVVVELTADAGPIELLSVIGRQLIMRDVEQAADVASQAMVAAEKEVVREVGTSMRNLSKSLYGAKSDALIPLLITSFVIPICRRLKMSPILGFLLGGTLLGPSCLNCINDLHTMDYIGEIGIVFFLFEMGLELSIQKLRSMRKDVFGLGLSQFLATSFIFAKVASLFGLSSAEAITVGGGLALSSSAFVLQLLKDKSAMGTRHGKASFGVLLLQDLAVVPVLIIVQLLGQGDGTSLGRALALAASKAVVALTAMCFVGGKLLDPVFYLVSKSNSHEAFLAITLCVVLLMSFVTEGIGLSGTLGAFLAGLLLAETRYSYQIESDMKPFRGILLGFFFMSVGFSIDLGLIRKSPALVSALTASLIAAKSIIVTLLSMLFGISFTSALQTGLLLSQGGEFAFVAFGIAKKSGILSQDVTKLLLTCVALSMALTPFLADAGTALATKIEERSGFSHYRGEDKGSEEIKSGLTKNASEFVIICGYGRVGKMVCDMLDRKFIRWVALDRSPKIAMDARNRGLPVFYGDVNRPEVLEKFGANAAKACVLTIDDMSSINRAVISTRKNYQNLPLIVRAKDQAHKERLEKKFGDITVMSAVLPEDSSLLTLPFGGAVLQGLGVSAPEINTIIDDMRDDFIDKFSIDFLTSLRDSRNHRDITEKIKSSSVDNDKGLGLQSRVNGAKTTQSTSVGEAQEEQVQELHKMIAVEAAGAFIAPADETMGGLRGVQIVTKNDILINNDFIKNKTVGVNNEKNEDNDI
jgi:monovalent cation:H+ antiporter-2, CPA2 family